MDRTVGEICGLMATEAFPAPAPMHTDSGGAPVTVGAPPAWVKGRRKPPQSSEDSRPLEREQIVRHTWV